MPTWQQIRSAELLGNPLGAWTLALVVFLVVLAVLLFARSYIGARQRRWTVADRARMADAIELAALLTGRTRRPFLWVVALYAGSRVLDLPPSAERAVTVLVVVSFWFQAGLWAMAAVRLLLEKRVHGPGAPDPRLAGSLELIFFVASLAIWSVAALLALANLGINVLPLLAGLGIGGIAVALAVQAVLSDILASVSIALDKPFAVGDFLILDNFLGTVEHIGVKSTRLRSLSGEQIIMSNADILSSRVRNYGRMYERRVVFQFGVPYDTPSEKLRAIPPLVRRIIESLEKTRFDRCHFMAYGEFSLQFETVYYVLAADYNVYADLQQAINLAIFDEFRKMGVRFALPTRTLRMESPISVMPQPEEAMKTSARSEPTAPGVEDSLRNRESFAQDRSR